MKRHSAEEALRHALYEDRGALIVTLHEMPLDELQALVDAAQVIDEEGQDALEARESEAA